MSFEYGDDPFILENFLEITSEDLGFQNDIRNVYNQIGSTPEGQAMIEAAWEMNNRQRISVHGVEDGDSEAFSDEGKIILSKSEISVLQYYDTENKIQNMSLNRVAFHEIYHLSDVKSREFKALGRDAQVSSVMESLAVIAVDVVSRYLGKDVDKNQAIKIVSEASFNDENGELMQEMKLRMANSKPPEVRAIDAANAFMEKYYDASPRDGHITPEYSSEATPEMEIYNNNFKP